MFTTWVFVSCGFFFRSHNPNIHNIVMTYPTNRQHSRRPSQRIKNYCTTTVFGPARVTSLRSRGARRAKASCPSRRGYPGVFPNDTSPPRGPTGRTAIRTNTCLSGTAHTRRTGGNGRHRRCAQTPSTHRRRDIGGPDDRNAVPPLTAWPIQSAVRCCCCRRRRSRMPFPARTYAIVVNSRVESR